MAGHERQKESMASWESSHSWGLPKKLRKEPTEGSTLKKGHSPSPVHWVLQGGGGDALRLWPQQKSALVPPQAREPNPLSFGVSSREIEQLTESS